MLLIIIAAAAALRRQQSSTQSNPPRLSAPLADGSGRFHAVSIRFGASPCNKARHLHGQRFLSEAAPRLPMDGCDAANCDCRFVHHADRRAGDDRRSPFQRGFGGSALRVEQNRRARPDRRIASFDQ
ncbi:MAG: hypothetical protein WD672_06825 [Woeseia sp.]